MDHVTRWVLVIARVLVAANLNRGPTRERESPVRDVLGN